MEDTQDKVRRNLVALSSIIIAVWFLDLELKDQASLFGLAEVSKVAPTKAWFAALIMLGYIFLRYRFDDHTNEQILLMKTDHWRRQLHEIEQLAAKEMTSFVRGGRRPTMLKDPESYADVLCEGETIRDCAGIKELNVTATIEQTGTPLKGRVGFSTKCTLFNGNTRAWEGGILCHYAPGKLRRAIVYIKALVKMACRTNGGVDVLVPFILFGLACCICLGKLGLASYALQ